jgi:class 3 adenylate cyclase/tetratricopeptide (TPR) repeat protein
MEELMSDLLSNFAAYVPPTLTRTILKNPSLSTEPVAERFPAAVLFADVSGFTPLTESLAQKGPEGPEELTRLLNDYFSRMIAIIEAEGGEVVKFSGDAVTVLFPACDNPLSYATRRAQQAAKAMQAAMYEFATLQTSAGPIALGMKIGIGAGEIVTMQVGGIAHRWEYVLAGDPIRQVAQAEGQAERGDIVLSPEAEALKYPEPVPCRPLQVSDWSEAQDSDLLLRKMRRFIPSGIQGWLEEGLREWLMSVLFIGVGGLDYEQPEAVAHLNNFFRAAQEVIYRYDGSVNKLAVDDKGTILLILLGAPPKAHEDDPVRAVRCALDLQKIAAQQGLSLLVGVTTGQVFAGPVGSETRREYTVMGDTVNLAARLMKKAGYGGTLCDFDTYREARQRITFETLPPVRVKGKAEEIPIYRPTTPATRSRLSTLSEGQSTLVGRREEVAQMEAALDALQDGQGSVLILEGEAGIGKSRLVGELAHMVQTRGLTGLLGAGQSIEQQTPYRAWRDVFTSYFALQEGTSPADRRQRVETLIKQLAPDQLERMPLLNDVLSLAFPESDLTETLDPTLRQQSLFLLLDSLLHAWARALSLVLVIEDAHWLDSVSWELLLQVARSLTVSGDPLLLVVVTRPIDAHTVAARHLATIRGLDISSALSLTTLRPEETVALVTNRLGLPAGSLPQSIADLVRERAEGNPFFAEEMALTLRDQGVIHIEPAPQAPDENRCVIRGDLHRAVRTLPTTVQGLVLTRIDRLAPARQLPLKVASVIGRTFAYTTLYYTLNRHATVTDEALRSHLDALAILDLTPVEVAEPELIYIFKHIITQEVAYETLLFAQRRQLHRTVAAWYENTYRANGEYGEEAEQAPLSAYYPLLVHHYNRAEDREQERTYAKLAGERAAAQFANAEAVRYLSRALELTPENAYGNRYMLLLTRAQVYDVQGERAAEAQDLAALTTLANALNDEQRKAEVALRYAAYHEATSDFPAALKSARGAIQWAKRASSSEQEIAGLIAAGRALWRQGKFEEARQYLVEALDLARQHSDRAGEADSLHNLGTVLYFLGNHEEAQRHLEQAREIRHVLGNRRGEAISLNNLAGVYHALGDFAQAKVFSEQALAIYQSIGDRRNEAQGLSNLGNIYHALGELETTIKHHEQALTIFKVINDRRGEAVANENLGLIFHELGDNMRAKAYCEQALEIERDIGDQESEGYSLTYLGLALEGLGNLEAAHNAYQEALHLRREIGQTAHAIDDLAGLARVALAQGQVDKARTYVEETLTWIENNGIAGIEYPLRVYLTGADVFVAMGQPEQAADMIQTAHALLLEQAAKISDEATRQAFLENGPLHRELQEQLAAFAETG